MSSIRPPMRLTYSREILAELDRDGRPGSMFDRLRRVLGYAAERGSNLRRNDQQQARELLERVEALAGDLARFAHHLRDGRDSEVSS